MVHAFKALNSYFLVDTESGSVFETDELTYYLVLSETEPSQGFEDRLKSYPAAFKEEAEAELRELAAQGLLFTEATQGDGVLVSHSGPVGHNTPFPCVVPSGPRVIKALCLNVCHACNLRCGYCFADGGTYGGSHSMMSADTARAAVDFLIEKSGNRRSLEIDFFGGEPLLNFETVRAAVVYARGREKETGKRFRFTVTTNGIALDGEKSAFINKEFSNAVISIDGRESVHNLIRKSPDGKDYYRAVVDNALSLIKHREGDYFIRGTFTNKNLDFGRDVQALSDLGFKYISMEPVALPDTHPLAIREEHLERIYSEYEALAKALLTAGDGAPDFFHFRVDLTGAPCRDKLLKGCGAGSEYAAVSPEGKIYPCHQFDGKEEYLMGVLGPGGAELYQPAKRVPEYPVLSRGECRVCWAKYYCGGGCAANSVNFCGDAQKPYDTACRLFKKRAELAIALYVKKRQCRVCKSALYHHCSCDIS